MAGMGPAVRAVPEGQGVFETGRAAWHRGDLVTARRCFEQVLRAKPDFELAKIHLAQVAAAERELAKIPKSLKLARTAVVERFAVEEATVAEAAAMLARCLERAGGGAEKWTVNFENQLPVALSERLLTFSAAGVTFDQALEALGTAAGVRFSYTAGGIAASAPAGERGVWDAGEPAQPGLDKAARGVMLHRLALADADAAEALAYLSRKAAEVSSGAVRPIFVMRHGSRPRQTVTLDLRNVSLYDAVRSVCLVADLEEVWFPWGAGIGSRQASAAGGPEAGSKAEDDSAASAR